MKKIIKLILVSMPIALANINVLAQPTNASAEQSEQQALAQIKALQKQEIAKQNQAGSQLVGKKTANQEALQVNTKSRTASQAAKPQQNRLKHASKSPDAGFQYPFAKSRIRLTPEQHEINSKAFASTARGLLPMAPRQIHRLRQLYTASQFAAAAPAGVPAKPVATSMFVNLSPGSTPPVILLSEGFVTSIVFLDSTGAPWPIESYDIGDPQAFDIKWNKKSNTLMIQARTLYTYGNLAIRLRDLNTPIMITLTPGQKVVDYRVDMTVPGYGPNAKALPVQTGLPPAAAPALLNALDGVPPPGSKALKLSKNIGKAWLLDGKIYLRTKQTLLSPGWLSTMSSADGTHIYELQKTPLLLIAHNGSAVQVKLKGF